FHAFHTAQCGKIDIIVVVNFSKRFVTTCLFFGGTKAAKGIGLTIYADTGKYFSQVIKITNLKKAHAGIDVARRPPCNHNQRVIKLTKLLNKMLSDQSCCANYNCFSLHSLSIYIMLGCL